MRAEILNEATDQKQYETFVSAHPHGSFFQSFTWARYQLEAFQRKSFIVVVWENEQLLCSALCVIHRLSLGLTSYIYSPRGPLLSTNQEVNQLLFREIKKIASIHKAAFFLFDPPILAEHFPQYDFLSPPEHSPKARFQKSTSHQPQTTLFLDLRMEENEILAQMKEKGRYNIRLAQKRGVIIRTGTVEELYPLLVETGTRDGFGIHPKGVYQKMVEVFGGQAVVLLAEYDRQIISGGIFIYDGQLALYYYGASSNTHRNVMAPYLLQLEAMREGKRRGCTAYDFLGIADEEVRNHRLSGVTEFKTKFGGKSARFIGAYREVYSAFWTWLYDLRHREKPVAHDCQTE